MTGEDLLSYGFGAAHVFNEEFELELLGELESAPGVYAISADMFGRFVGESDIVYIGCAGDLHARIESYYKARYDEYYRFSGNILSTSGRVANLLIAPPSRQSGVSDMMLGLTWVVTRTVDGARQLESDLLREYGRAHWEFPPLNRRGGSEGSNRVRRAVRTAVGTGWVWGDKIRMIFDSAASEEAIGAILDAADLGPPFPGTVRTKRYEVTVMTSPGEIVEADSEVEAVTIVLNASRLKGW